MKKHINDKMSFKFVEGPVKIIEYFSQNLNKHIYLVSDLHVSLSTCVPNSSIHIAKFIDNILNENKDKIIDVYFEVEFISKKLNEKKLNINVIRKTDREPKDINDYLTQTMVYFKDCLDIDKSTCPYKNSRFHYVDIRFDKSIFFLSLYYNTYLQDKSNIERISFKEALYNIISVLYPLDEKIIKLIMNKYKLSRQLDNIKDGDVKNKILSYFNKKINNFREELDWLINKYNSINVINFNVWFQKWMHFTLEFGSTIMDIYTVSRIMRSFKNGPDAKYILIYCGEAHIKHISEILELLKFDEIAKSTNLIKGVDSKNLVHLIKYGLIGNIPFQCLDISGFKQPFFTY